MDFSKTIRRLRDVLNDERQLCRDRTKVMVDRRDLRWLMDDWERMDHRAREQYMKDHPELYPPGVLLHTEKFMKDSFPEPYK